MLRAVIALAGVDSASARRTYTYINSGYCPNTMKHVRDVSRCGTTRGQAAHAQ